MTPGAMVVGAVFIGAYIYYLLKEAREARREARHLSKMFDSAAEVCGFTWCKEPRESFVHAPPDSNIDGTHAYRKAKLVVEPIMPLKPAWRDNPLTFANEIKPVRRR